MICLTFHCKLRRSVNRLSNPRVGSTAAKICDLADYVRVGRARVLSQQCRGRHDLSWLTIPALRHIASTPGYLHRMLRVWRESFYSRDIFPGHLAYRLHARAHRLAIHVHRTRPAQRNSTPVLRSGQTNRVPDHPQQRCLWLHVYGVHLPLTLSESMTSASQSCAYLRNGYYHSESLSIQLWPSPAFHAHNRGKPPPL